ncbi:hypothetical protein JCM8097_002580 [Rhodosporidiobolus ruineniae]
MRPAPPVPLPGVGDWFASLDNFRHHISRTAESNQLKLKLFRSPGTPAGSCELRCAGAGADSHAKQVFCTYRCRADPQPDGSFVVTERDDSHSCPKHAANRTDVTQETMSRQHSGTSTLREKRKARSYGSDEYEPEPSSSDEERYKTRSTRSRRQPDLYALYLPNPDEQKKADALLMAVENGKYLKKAELLSEAVALARSGPVFLPSPEQPFDSVYDLLVLLHAFFEQNPLRPFRRDRRGRISISCSEAKKTGCPVSFKVVEGPDEKWRLTKQIFQHAPSCSSHGVAKSTLASNGPIQSMPIFNPPPSILPAHLAALLTVFAPDLPPPQAKKHSARLFQAGISSVDFLVTLFDLEDSFFDAFVEVLVGIEPRLAANEADELLDLLREVKRAWAASD